MLICQCRLPSYLVYTTRTSRPVTRGHFTAGHDIQPPPCTTSAHALAEADSLGLLTDNGEDPVIARCSRYGGEYPYWQTAISLMRDSAGGAGSTAARTGAGPGVSVGADIALANSG